jgi:hypothetical protein
MPARDRGQMGLSFGNENSSVERYKNNYDHGPNRAEK